MTDAQYEDLIKFGETVKQFCQGEIGKYLLEKAAEERDAAMADLAEVDPHNAKEIMRLQNIIARNSSFGMWLAEGIKAGEDSKNILAGEEP